MFLRLLVVVIGKFNWNLKFLRIPSPISNCANISSLIYNKLRENYGAVATNWTGFYFRSGPRKGYDLIFFWSLFGYDHI